MFSEDGEIFIVYAKDNISEKEIKNELRRKILRQVTSRHDK